MPSKTPQVSPKQQAPLSGPSPAPVADMGSNAEMAAMAGLAGDGGDGGGLGGLAAMMGASEEEDDGDLFSFDNEEEAGDDAEEPPLSIREADAVPDAPAAPNGLPKPGLKAPVPKAAAPEAAKPKPPGWLDPMDAQMARKQAVLRMSDAPRAPTPRPKIDPAAKEAHDAKSARMKEVAGTLGDGRARTYFGEDEERADARKMAEDPRFQERYPMDREYDHKGAVGRARDDASQKFAEVKEGGLSGAAKDVGRAAARAVPVLGAGIAAHGAYKDHKRAKVDDEVAGDEDASWLSGNVAAGLAQEHRKGRNMEIGRSVASVASTAVNVATGGLGALVPDVGTEMLASGGAGLYERGADAVGSAGKLAVNAAEGAGRAAEGLAKDPDAYAKGAPRAAAMAGNRAAYGGVEPHEVRPSAVARPETGNKGSDRASMDRANAGLGDLAHVDGAFGRNMLDYTAEEQAPAGPKGVLDAARSFDPREGDHTVKPSLVASITQGEGARQREKERMGENLPKLRENEKRGMLEKPVSKT